MYHVTVSVDTYELTPNLEGQNPFIDVEDQPNVRQASKQHSQVRDELLRNVHFKVKTERTVPDMVFIASAGLSLPRLPEPVVILPNMKFKTRKAELPYIKQIMEDLKVKTFPFPSSEPFEGQAEVRWFDGGHTLVHGYGYRSTRESTRVLRDLVNKIYLSYGVEPPKFIAARVRSPKFYHMDMAMLAYSPTGCLVHSGAFDQSTLQRLRKYIGYVTEVETDDPFGLNAVVLEDKIISHVQTDAHLRELIKDLSEKELIEVDVSEFEKAGGAVACLVFTVYDSSLIKKKNNYRSPPVSPR